MLLPHTCDPRTDTYCVMRVVNGLLRSEYCDARVVQALAKWAGKRREEFRDGDWDRLQGLMGVLRERSQGLGERSAQGNCGGSTVGA